MKYYGDDDQWQALYPINAPKRYVFSMHVSEASRESYGWQLWTYDFSCLLARTTGADRPVGMRSQKYPTGECVDLVYDSELHDVTLFSTRDKVWHDSDRVKAVVKDGKPLIFFHNHPAEDGRAAMFPSYDDFGAAALFPSWRTPRIRV